jgi:hypothetical protein
MKRESKKPQYQQDDRNSPQHRLSLLFETRFVQAIYSDVTVGQGYPDAWKLTEESKEKFEQKVAKEAKIWVQNVGSSKFCSKF